MRGMRSPGGLTAALVIVGTLLLAGTSISAAASGHARAARWSQEFAAGTHVYKRQVPLAVKNGSAQLVRQHAASAQMTLNFSFPLRHRAALDRLIARQAKTHTQM